MRRRSSTLNALALWGRGHNNGTAAAYCVCRHKRETSRYNTESNQCVVVRTELLTTATHSAPWPSRNGRDISTCSGDRNSSVAEGLLLANAGLSFGNCQLPPFPLLHIRHYNGVRGYYNRKICNFERPIVPFRY